MNNYYVNEAAEVIKRTAAIGAAATVFTVGTYGGSKVGHAIVNGVEDVVVDATKEISKTVKKTVKKAFRKKKFFGMF